MVREREKNFWKAASGNGKLATVNNTGLPKKNRIGNWASHVTTTNLVRRSLSRVCPVKNGSKLVPANHLVGILHGYGNSSRIFIIILCHLNHSIIINYWALSTTGTVSKVRKSA
jgi:hypothetical protein